ncbi:MAG TPA: tetratricopeptide repeat protein [Fulvivirga sp.]|nr:tetratricopeptide repeat protein [Fulvivirga sp.]
MRYWIIAFLLITSNYAFGQDQTTASATKQEQPLPTAGQVLTMHYFRTYQAGIRYNDYSIAKHALYNILVENPQNDSILYSLSVLYFQSKQYASAALTAQDVITLNPNNLAAIEIAAVSYENIGALDKALETYESLYLKSDDYETLYKVAFLQYEVKNYAEAKTNADILLGKKEAETLTATFDVAGGQQKEYPIKVALLNLKGLIAKDQGKKEEAKTFFQQALKLAPDFTMAKDSLAELNK